VKRSREATASQSIVARGRVSSTRDLRGIGRVTAHSYDGPRNCRTRFDADEDWVLEGAPRTRAKVLAVSQDGAICIMAWDCSAGRFKWLYSEDEIAHIISGAVVITDERGEERRLTPGDTAFFPAGSTSTWHVPFHVRKLAVLHHAIPVSLSFALRALRRVRRSLPSKYIPAFGTWPSGG
jgi:uncharacterized cupin superfamily protein